MRRDEDGKTPLHYAVLTGNFSITSLLLMKNANIFVLDKNITSTLSLSNGIKILLDKLISNSEEFVNFHNATSIQLLLQNASSLIHDQTPVILKHNNIRESLTKSLKLVQKHNKLTIDEIKKYHSYFKNSSKE